MLPQGNLRIYGCGGCGINIASKYEKSSAHPEAGYAVAHPVYIDTSRSNLSEELDPQRFALLDDRDGSGGVRTENYEPIAKSVNAILQDHPPMDFNVVVFSGSGGSGSVFGPVILSELLARGLPVVAVVIGSGESAIRAKNTLKTIKSLESIAETRKLPVVMYYDHNENTVKRSDVDRRAQAAIGSISILTSRQNRELDTKDIANWLQFNRVSNVRPRLAVLDVHYSNEEAESVKSPVSIASLYNNPDADKASLSADYDCTGYPVLKNENFNCLHFVITIDEVQTIAKKLQASVAEVESQSRSRVDHNSLVSDQDKVTDTGLVL